MTSGPVGPRPGSGLGPIEEFGAPLRPQEPQGPQPMPAMQGPPPAPPAEIEQPDPAAMVPEAPQEPQDDLRGARTRLELLLASRSRALQMDVLNDLGEVVVPGMDPTAADAEARKHLVDFVRRGPTIYPNKQGQFRKVDPKAELREYLLGGQPPQDWLAATQSRWGTIKSQKTIQDEVQEAATQRGMRAAREFREDSPVLAGLVDYVADPVTTFAMSVAQVPVDVVSGLTNLAIAPFTDSRIPPVELKRDLMTGAAKLFTGGDPAAMAFAESNQQGFAETKSAGAELVEGAAGIAGMVRGMAGKTGGKLLGFGGQVGEATVRQVAKMTGREANRFWSAVGRGSGSFGAYEAVAGKAIDETTGELRAPTLGERGENMLRGMVVGPIVEGANAAASRALMRLYGKGLAYSSPENKKAVDSVLGWAKKQGYTKVVSESEEAFYGRVVQDYVSAGLPGARMSVRKAIGNVVRASVEGAGFASLDLFDAQYRAKLYQAVIEGDSEALSMMLMSWGQNALGLLFIHAKSPGDVLRMMRRQPIEQPRQSDLFDFSSPLRAGQAGVQGLYILGVDPQVARNVDAFTGIEIKQIDAFTGSEIKQDPQQPARPRQRQSINPATGTVIEQGMPQSAFERAQAEAAERNRAWLAAERNRAWMETFQARKPQRTVTDPATGAAMQRVVNPQRNKATGTTLEGDNQPIDLGPSREILQSVGWEAKYFTEEPVFSEASAFKPEPSNPKATAESRRAELSQRLMNRGIPNNQTVEVPINAFGAARLYELVGKDTKVGKQLAAVIESGDRGEISVPFGEFKAFARTWSKYAEKGVETLRDDGRKARAEANQSADSWMNKVAKAFDGASPASRGQGPSRPVELELPGTPHKVTVDNGEATIKQETATWLGLDKTTMPIDEFLSRAVRATLLESVQGQVYLPGVAVLPGGVKIDAMGTLRQVRGGAIYEQKAEPGAKWEKAKDPVAVPRADTISPEQQATADALRYLMEQRADLTQGDRVLLDATIQVLDRVSAARDEGVADALQSIGAIADRLERGTPQQAAQAIDDLAEIMSQRAPEAVLARRNAQEAVAKADAEFEAKKVAEEAEAEAKATAEVLGEKPVEVMEKPVEPAAEIKPADPAPEPAKAKKAKKAQPVAAKPTKADFELRNERSVGYAITPLEGTKGATSFSLLPMERLEPGWSMTKMTRGEYEAKYGLSREPVDVSAMPKWQRKPIELAIDGSLAASGTGGPLFQLLPDAQVYGGLLAVQPPLSRGGLWKISHAPSGLGIGAQADSASRARELVEKFWDRMSPLMREALARGTSLRNIDDKVLGESYRMLGEIAEELGAVREPVSGFVYRKTSKPKPRVTEVEPQPAKQPEAVDTVPESNKLPRDQAKPADLVKSLRQIADKASKSEKARLRNIADKLEASIGNDSIPVEKKIDLMSEAQAAIAGYRIRDNLDALASPRAGAGTGARSTYIQALYKNVHDWADGLAVHSKATDADSARLEAVLDIWHDRYMRNKIGDEEMLDRLKALAPVGKGKSGDVGLIFTPGSLADDAALVARAATNAARGVQRAMTSFYGYAFEPTWRYLQRFGTGRFVNTARDIELRGNELSGQAERVVTPAITEYRRLRAESRGAIDEVQPNEQGAMEPAWLDLVEGRRQPANEREAAVAANSRQALLTMWEQLRAAGAVRTVLNAEGNVEYQRFDERTNPTVPRYPGRDHDAMMGDPAMRLRYWDAQAERNPATVIDAETGRPRPRTGQDLVDAMLRTQSAGTTIDAIQRQANAEIARELHNLDYTFEGREIWSTDFELVMEQTHMQQPRRAAWIERNGPGVPPDVAQRLGIEQNINPDELFLEYARSLNTGSNETNNVLLQQARDYAQILQGRNPHLKDTNFTRFMRKVQPIENMARASLTGVKAALWDLPAAALMPVLYSRRGEWARLLFEFADPERLRSNWREAYEHAFRIGMISRSVSSHDQAVPASLRGLGRLTRILNRPSEISEQFKGAAAYRVGNFLLERWDAGGATDSDRNLLRILRLPQRFAEGRLTEAERNTFLLEYGKQVTARTDLAGASALASDPGMRMHIRFLRWATRAMHNAGRVVQAVGEAQTPAERRAAWERVAKMGFVYTASGLAGQLLGTVFADAFRGENGFARFWRELTSSPMAAVNGALTGFTSQVTGGAVSTLLGFANEPTVDNMARLTVLSQYGYTAVKGVQGLADALWSYSTGEARKDPHSLSQFIHNTGLLPLSREVAGAGQMLHARYHGYEALRQDRNMARWFERLAGIPNTYGERKWPQAYYDKLEEMARAVSAGAKPAEWIKANMDSLKAVLEVAPTESLAQAMRARQLVSNWSPAERQRFADTINDTERVRRIYEFDSTVREMANEIRKLEGARPTGFAEELEAVASQAHLGAGDKWNRLVETAIDDAVAGQPESIVELADKLAMFPHQLDEVFKGETMQRRLARTKDVASRAWLIRRELETRARGRIMDERRERAKERRNQ